MVAVTVRTVSGMVTVMTGVSGDSVGSNDAQNSILFSDPQKEHPFFHLKTSKTPRTIKHERQH